MEKDSKSALTVAPPSGPNSVLSLADRIAAKTKSDAELIQKKSDDEQQQLGLALTSLSQNALSTTKGVISSQLSALTEGVESTAASIKTVLTDQGAEISSQAAEMKSSLTGPQNSVKELLTQAQADRAQAKSELAHARWQAKWIVGMGIAVMFLFLFLSWFLTESELFGAQTENRIMGNGKTYTLILSPGWTQCQAVANGPFYPCILKK